MSETKETLDQIADDLEMRLDNFFDRINQLVLREARKLKEDVRAVCVDYPHIPADKIKELYLAHTKRLFKDTNLLVEWRKEAEILA